MVDWFCHQSLPFCYQKLDFFCEHGFLYKFYLLYQSLLVGFHVVVWGWGNMDYFLRYIFIWAFQCEEFGLHSSANVVIVLHKILIFQLSVLQRSHASCGCEAGCSERWKLFSGSFSGKIQFSYFLFVNP